ncbi:DUF1330 domain-containing protein [Yinghuangia sp. ASG 101]|uniref:DUF1330 domain-containing protein n=1 Tax=Yinghuangia sp. ASG 101 TaxID=2896848 RepID=UPI001E5CB7F0|nr:DUF1330 domain-containing protein [Yinghuangia sp. ASG 101]UGQ14761.1 DUF1330 domain-containing protein [Yinghuangia sp. ASG 101]
MPKAYVILTEAIRDRAVMREYEKASTPPLLKYHGTVLAATEDGETVEGEWHGTRTVLVEFASVEAARAWYESPEYQAAKPLREKAADCNVVIVPGFEFGR